MHSLQTPPNTISEYIALYPPDIQQILECIRTAIRAAAPTASEMIAYGIPTFTLHGYLVHFAAYKTHIGFYPTPSGMEAFKAELTGYRTSKGTVQFPLNQPIPYDLVHRIVLFRVQENLARAAAKKNCHKP